LSIGFDQRSKRNTETKETSLSSSTSMPKACGKKENEKRYKDAVLAALLVYQK
jgi:hypothetical protein